MREQNRNISRKEVNDLLCGARATIIIDRGGQFGATIPTSTRSLTYAPVAATGPFPIDFPLFDGTGADLLVTLDGEEVSGWTFSGTIESGFYGAPNTWVNCSITFASPITGALVIDGRRDPRRQAQFTEGGGVPARNHNTELNTLIATDQELRRDVDRNAADIAQHDERLTAAEAKNVEQDGRLGAIETEQGAQNAQLANHESRLSAAEPVLSDVALRAVRVPPGEVGVTLPSVSARALRYAAYALSGDPIATEAPAVVIGSGLADFSSAVAAIGASLPPGQSFFTTAGFYGPSLGGGARYAVTAIEPVHAGKIPLAAGLWGELAEEVPNEKQFGGVGDDVADDKAVVQALIAWAMIDPKRRKIALQGRCYCASDLANFHDVQWEGPGSVRVGTGTEFFVTPSGYNRGFSGVGVNTYHVAPDDVGSALASGLAPEFPITVEQLRVALARRRRSVLDRVEFAQGVYRTALNLWNSSSEPATLYLRGPAVDAWNNTTPPPDAKAITAIGATNPATFTVVAHGLSNGDEVFVGLAKKAGGYHEADGAIYTVTATDADTLTLSGVDGSSWSAYTGSGKVYPLKGSRPKAIFYGSGLNAGSGLQFQGNDAAEVNDIASINWGEKGTTGQDTGLTATQFANVRLYNFHALDNTAGVMFRDQSTGYWFSGEGSDNRQACFAIDARYTFGVSNPASVQNNTLLIKRNFWAAYIWEGASGHMDGNRLVDNNTDIHVRRAGHCVGIKNEITNTGSIRPSCIVDEGGVMPNPWDNTWIGSFRPTFQRRANSSGTETGHEFDWITAIRLNWPALGAGLGETTLLTHTLRRSTMSLLGQGLRVRGWNVLSALTGTLTIRAKLDGVTLTTMVIPAGVSRHFEFDLEAIATGFDGCRARWRHTLDDNAGAVSNRVLLNSWAFNTLAADAVFTITLQLSAGADTLGGFGFVQLESQG